MPSAAQTRRNRKGGLALLAKRGLEHYAEMGRKGGRPTFEESLTRARLKAGELTTAARARSRPGRKPSH